VKVWPVRDEQEMVTAVLRARIPRPGSPGARLVLAGASVIAILAWAIPCQAGGPCRVEMAGLETPEWRQAVRALLAARLTGGDCASIHVEVRADGARLTFTTADGRRAARDLLDPDELRPAVEALRVTLPAAERQPPAPAPDRERRPSPGARAADPRLEAGAHAPALVVALLGGTRRGDEVLFSPVLSGSASLVLRRWELGVTAALESQSFDAPDQEAAAGRSKTAAIGVIVGRREPIRRIDLLAGGRLSIAALFDEDEHRGSTELRAGGYLGVSLVRTGRLRLRAELGAELVGGNHSEPVMGGATGAIGDSGAFDPRWAITALVGAELGGP
jgi:hypothetical protein